MAFKFLKTDFSTYLKTNKKIKHAAIMLKYKAVLEKGL